jgi:hypothetical protein
VSVSFLLHCATMVHMQWFGFLKLLVSKQRKFMSLMEGVVGLIQLDKLTCYPVGAHEQCVWTIVCCVGALLSLISFVACATCSCTTKGHSGSFSCKQGQCIHGNFSKVPCHGCLLVTCCDYFEIIIW